MNEIAIEKNYRREIGDDLLVQARKNPKIVLFVCDMGFGVTHQFKEEFPNRIFNMGMMEQGTVGIAAGMAMTGMVPIVYSIVNFLVFRAVEQVRNDVVKQGLNVKFVATGVNDYFKFLGPSHCCGQDDKTIMQLINLKVYDPYEDPNVDFSEMVDEWGSDPQAGYLRI
jgi:transketolase